MNLEIASLLIATIQLTIIAYLKYNNTYKFINRYFYTILLESLIPIINYLMLKFQDSSTSLVHPNLLSMTEAIIFQYLILKFTNVKISRLKKHLLYLFLGIIILTSLYFTYINPIYQIRNPLTTFLQLICTLLISYYFHKSKVNKKAKSISILFFGIISVLILVKFFLIIYYYPNIPQSYSEDHLINTISSFSYFILTVYFFPFLFLISQIISEEYYKRGKMKIRENNDEINKLLSIISHDLKTPFNSLIGISSILINETTQNSKVDLHQYHQAIYNTSKSAFQQLENLIELGKIIYKKNYYPIETIELDNCKPILASRFKNLAESKNIKLIMSCDDNICIYGNEAMFNSILTNLISNALKFSFPGSEIIVKAEQIGKEIQFSVTDYGIGMSLELITSILQNNNSASSRLGTLNEKGTGLGLFLCKEMVEKLGGRLWFKSTEGLGTTAYFTIPTWQKDSKQ